MQPQYRSNDPWQCIVCPTCKGENSGHALYKIGDVTYSMECAPCATCNGRRMISIPVDQVALAIETVRANNDRIWFRK